MKKSLIHELAYLNNSRSMTERSQYITTSLTEDQTVLNSTRIRNIPTYKKKELSLPFTVVFQSIEIQRLSEEIEVLKVAVSQRNRYQSDQESFEIQIKELAEKCEEYYREKQIVEDKYQKLRLKYQKSFDSSKFETKQDRLPFRQLLSRISQLLLKVQQKCFLITEICTNLQQLHKNASSDSDPKSVKKQLQFLGQISFAKSGPCRCRNVQIQIKEIVSTIGNKKIQIIMLSHQIVELSNQIERARRRASPERELAESEFSELQIRISKLEEQNARNEQLASKAEQYLKVIDRSQGEIERLQNVVIERVKEAEIWKQKNRKLELELSETRGTSNIFNGMSPSRLRHAQEEREQAEDDLKYKNSQVEELRAKCQSYERTINNYKIIEKQKRGLEEQLHYQIKISDDYERKLHYLQDAASHLHQLENELNNEESRKMEYIEEIERLNGIIEIKSSESENLSKKISSLQDQIRGLKSVERQVLEERRNYEYMEAELVKLNKLVSEKSGILERIKDELKGKSFNNGQKSEISKALDKNVKELNEIYEKLEESSKKNDDYQISIMQLNSEISGLKNEITVLRQQNESFQNMNYQKTEQCEAYKSEMMKRIDQIRELRKFESNTYQLQVKLNNVEQGYADIERRYKKECYRTEDLHKQVNNAKSEMEKMKREGVFPTDFMNEFTTLKKNHQAKEKQFKDMESKFILAEKALKMMKKEMVKQTEACKMNHKKWNRVLDGLSDINNFTNKAVQTHNQVGMLSEQNIHLESSTKILGLEMEMNKKMTRSFMQGQSSQLLRTPTQASERFTTLLTPEMKSMNTIQSSSTILVKQDMRKSAIEPGNSYQYKSRYQSKFLNSSNQ